MRRRFKGEEGPPRWSLCFFQHRLLILDTCSIGTKVLTLLNVDRRALWDQNMLEFLRGRSKPLVSTMSSSWTV